jgi:hypothetical protein
MNGQQPRDPELTYTDPKAYILWLRTRGLNPGQIDNLVRQRFGAGQTPQERAKQQASDAEKAGWAQAGGQVAGVAGGAYLGNQLFNSSAPQTASKFAESGTVGLTRTAPSEVTTVSGANPVVDLNAPMSAPKVISSEGAMSTVETPVGVQKVPTESLQDSNFWGNVNWSQVAQGGLGLAQMYGAYKSYQSGDNVGAGLSGLSGAANVASAAGANLGSSVVPGLNIATGAYTGYKTAQAIGDMAAGSQRTKAGVMGGTASGAAIGAGVGSLVPGVGTAIGAGIGALVGATAGAVGSWTGSSKGKAQFMRDNIRGVLQKNNVLDENYQGTLADGSKYDFGKDGKSLKWSEIDKIVEGQPKAWNAAVPAADALAASYGFVGQKASDIAAWYAKGAVSNAADDPTVARANMQHFAKQQGITMDLITQKLNQAKEENRINQTQYDYYTRGANDLLGGQSTNAKSNQTTTPIARPKKGEVGRQSAGLYRDDTGKLIQASSMRKALEKAYNKPKGKK